MSVKLNSIIPNEIAEIANFHFSHSRSMETISYYSNQNSYSTGIANICVSHYKSMENLSCHSNESSWTLKIKYTAFVESNVISKYAKFQFHPPYGF